MKLAILGATGPAGRVLTDAALGAGHHVVVYARSPSKLTTRHERLTVHGGELSDLDALRQALTGVDAVCSLLGPTPHKRNATTVAAGMTNVVTTMKALGIDRLIAVSTPSAPDPADGDDWRYGLAVGVVRTLLAPAYRDVVATAEVVRNSGLRWTLVRVGFLTHGPASASPHLGFVGDPQVGLRVSRATIAQTFLTELQDETWVGQAPVLSGV